MVRNNLGDMLCGAERFEEALEHLGNALEAKPDYANALCNAGLALWGLNHLERAEEALRASIKHGAPASAHMNLGLLLITQGKYQEGFQEYNYRFQAMGHAMRGGDIDLWDGKYPPIGRLYVWPEQGLGDEILHFGGAQHLADFADDVVWECDPRLISLFERAALKNIKFVPRSDTRPPDIDLQIPVGCLSQLYAPWEARQAYLAANPDRVAAYKAMMPTGKRVVGLSWKSLNSHLSHKKNLSLDYFAPFLNSDEYHCVDLQYGERDTHPMLHRIEGLDTTNDIDGLAAVMMACDMVLTVSNTTAHLAGALGVATVVVVSSAGGKLWYWGTGNRTDWYASVKVTRFLRDQSA